MSKYSIELENLINKKIKLGKLSELIYNKDENKIKIDFNKRMMDVDKNTYQVSRFKIFLMKYYIKKYNFPAWSNLPMGDLYALDSPVKTIELIYNTDQGLKSYFINYYSRLPQDGYEYLNKFINLIISLK